MNILIINTDKAKLYPLILKKSIEARGVHCYGSKWRKQEIMEMIALKKLSPLNTIIHARTAGPHVAETYKELEKSGYKIINKSSATELTSNKYQSQIFAGEQNIPVADTYKIKKTDLNKIKELSNKYASVVAKPIYSQGQGIFCKKIDKAMPDKATAESIAEIPGEEIIIQEYIEYKRLIRTIVIGYKIIKEALTFDVPGSGWKASVCLNPNIKKYDNYNYELGSLAEKTAKAFGTEVSFIDFFENQSGHFILNELNTACSLVIHEKATGVKIHEYIADYLVSCLPSS